MQDENMNVTENNSKPVQIDNGNFDLEVIESKLPVLVAFLTSWSRPCAVLSPVLDGIASECAAKLKVVRVDADSNLDLSLWYDVQSIPTLFYFVAGNVRAKIVGTATKEAILSKLESIRKAC
jgi:thioredoxin 1